MSASGADKHDLCRLQGVRTARRALRPPAGPRVPADAERVSGDFAPRERRPASPRTGAGPDGRAGSTALCSAARVPPACAAGIMHSTRVHGAGIAAMAAIRRSPQTHERGRVDRKEDAKWKLCPGMECAYSWHFFIFSLGSCRVVKQSFVLLNPNDFYRNECTSVFPHLNHQFFIKLEPGFESSDAFLTSTSEPYSTL